MADSIHIQSIQASVRIGVPEEERAQWQTVEIDITLTPKNDFHDLDDDIERTIDYAHVSLELRDLAAKHPRKLIETLAGDLAAHVIAEFPVRKVALTIRKFILPGTQWVAVSITRKA
ncbi:MAG: dihydroneopterin aldolase [Verrucomicrobiales bacterium]|jgi:dihydroneopterin aldolase